MNNAKKLWEQRSKQLGDSLASVLEQSFPDEVNEVISGIHVREIISTLPYDAKHILDVGCGWGRLAREVANQKKVYIYGVDIAYHFVKLFNKRLNNKGKALVGDMRKLPFADEKFDAAYCIESLMYMGKPIDQKRAIAEMLRVIKKEGVLILIEQNTLGDQLFRLGGFVPFVYRTILRKPKVETHGVTFRLSELKILINTCGGHVIARRGYPFFTLLLLPAVIIGKIFPGVSKRILLIASYFDRFLPITTTSYFVTWVVKKNKSNV